MLGCSQLAALFSPAVAVCSPPRCRALICFLRPPPPCTGTRMCRCALRRAGRRRGWQRQSTRPPRVKGGGRGRGGGACVPAITGRGRGGSETGGSGHHRWAGARLLVSTTASPSFKETTSSSLPSPASPLCLPLPPIHTQPSLSGCISILAALLSPDQTSGVQQQVRGGGVRV